MHLYDLCTHCSIRQANKFLWCLQQLLPIVSLDSVQLLCQVNHLACRSAADWLLNKEADASFCQVQLHGHNIHRTETYCEHSECAAVKVCGQKYLQIITAVYSKGR